MNVNHIVFSYRYFGLFPILYKNHYDALGLTPKATQGEIKSAYYKLSMIYHPDKNKGSDKANEKFKDITAAYEVLGNFKLRRLYDRGLSIDEAHLKNWGSQQPKDFSTKGSRVQTTRGPLSGRSPIYDFDEWSRLHYGQTLERRAHAKAKYEYKFGSNNESRRIAEKENVTYILIVIFSFFFLFSYVYRDDGFDTLAKPVDKK